MARPYFPLLILRAVDSSDQTFYGSSRPQRFPGGRGDRVYCVEYLSCTISLYPRCNVVLMRDLVVYLLQITKLKIDSNPFAKGFRDSSRLTDFERLVLFNSSFILLSIFYLRRIVELINFFTSIFKQNF